MKKFKKRLCAVMTAQAICPAMSTGILSPCISAAEETTPPTAVTETTDLPEWIPQSFNEALIFSNTYGKNHVADGFICTVFMEEELSSRYYYETSLKGSTSDYSDCVVLDESYEFTDPEKPDESDEAAMGEYENLLYQLGLPSDYEQYGFSTSSKYTVTVYKPSESGTMKIQHALMRTDRDQPVREVDLSFEISPGGDIEQTDIFGWLPDSITEYDDFHSQYGTASIHENMIVFCDDICLDGGLSLFMEQNGTAIIKELPENYDIGKVSLIPVPGEYSYTVRVYEVITPGTIKVHWSERQEWMPADTAEDIAINCYRIEEDGTITEIEENQVEETKPGDCNLDGKFDAADVLLLQKWLVRSDDTISEQRADFNKDGKLDVFDLILMKKSLMNESDSVLLSVDGSKVIYTYETAPEVTFRLDARNYSLPTPYDALPHAALYNADTDELIAFMDKDGEDIWAYTMNIDNSRIGTFKFYATVNGKEYCQGETVKTDVVSIFVVCPPEPQESITTPDKMPEITDNYGKVTDDTKTMLWQELSAKYPDTDFTDFTLVYDPDHPLNSYINGQLFNIYYKDILLHGYANLNTYSNVYAAVTENSEVIISFLAAPEEISKLDLSVKTISQEDAIETVTHEVGNAEIIIYNRPDNSPKLTYTPVLAYRAAAYDCETIVDAVTGEKIAWIPYYVD